MCEKNFTLSFTPVSKIIPYSLVLGKKISPYCCHEKLPYQNSSDNNTHEIYSQEKLKSSSHKKTNASLNEQHKVVLLNQFSNFRKSSEKSDTVQSKSLKDHSKIIAKSSLK